MFDAGISNKGGWVRCEQESVILKLFIIRLATQDKAFLQVLIHKICNGNWGKTTLKH